MERNGYYVKDSSWASERLPLAGAPPVVIIKIFLFIFVAAVASVWAYLVRAARATASVAGNDVYLCTRRRAHPPLQPSGSLDLGRTSPPQPLPP